MIQEPKRRRGVPPVTAVLVALGGTIAVVLFWMGKRPPPITSVATSAVRAMVSGDTDVLYELAFAEEIDANELTREKLATFWKQIILPRLSHYHQVGSLETQLNGGGDEGTAGISLEDTNGHRWEIVANVFNTDAGPRLPVLETLLITYSLRLVESGEDPTQLRRLEARLGGLRMDRPALEKLGIKYIFGLDHNGLHKRSLDDLEAGYVKAIQRAKEAADMKSIL